MVPARPTGQQNGGGPADLGRIMSPSPGADATVTDPANTVLIRSPVACSCTNLGWSRERGGARLEWACGPGGSMLSRMAVRSPDGRGHIVACGISPVHMHDNMTCGG